MASDVFSIQGSYDLVDKVSGKLDKISGEVDKNGKKVKGTEKEYSSFGDSIGSKASGIAKSIGAAFTVTAIVGFGKKITELASDLTQTQNKTKVVFGEMAGEVQKWAAENERSFGLGAGTIEKYTGQVA